MAQAEQPSWKRQLDGLRGEAEARELRVSSHTIHKGAGADALLPALRGRPGSVRPDALHLALNELQSLLVELMADGFAMSRHVQIACVNFAPAKPYRDPDGRSEFTSGRHGDLVGRMANVMNGRSEFVSKRTPSGGAARDRAAERRGHRLGPRAAYRQDADGRSARPGGRLRLARRARERHPQLPFHVRRARAQEGRTTRMVRPRLVGGRRAG